VSKYLTISGRLFIQNKKFIKRHEIGQNYKNKFIGLVEAILVFIK